MAAEAPGVVPGRQPDIILARLEVDYLRQLHYRVGEQVCVRSWVTRVGTKSFTMRQELIQDDQAAIRLDAVLVLFDVATDTSRPVTDEERAYWNRFMAA
jgi:acyl-CoA thioester hydrolase